MTVAVDIQNRLNELPLTNIAVSTRWAAASTVLSGLAPSRAGLGRRRGLRRLIRERPAMCGGSGRPAAQPGSGARPGDKMPTERSEIACTPPCAERQGGHGHDQRHRVERVGRVRAPVRLEHVLGVAVVGVTTHAPPARHRPRATTSPRQPSTVSIARTAAGITPVWPTMSGLAKLMIAKRGRSSCQAATNAAVASRRAHLGLACRTSARRAARARARAARPRSEPPRRR